MHLGLTKQISCNQMRIISVLSRCLGPLSRW
jgi:hypothetical protein